jgi:hypothetical protein
MEGSDTRSLFVAGVLYWASGFNTRTPRLEVVMKDGDGMGRAWVSYHAPVVLAPGTLGTDDVMS